MFKNRTISMTNKKPCNKNATNRKIKIVSSNNNAKTNRDKENESPGAKPTMLFGLNQRKLKLNESSSFLDATSSSQNSSILKISNASNSRNLISL